MRTVSKRVLAADRNAFEGGRGPHPSNKPLSGARAYLDEGESRSWLQRLVLVLHLIRHILLHPFFLVDLPLGHHVEEGARRDGDADSILGFGL